MRRVYVICCKEKRSVPVFEENLAYCEENLAYCDDEDQENGQRMTLKSGLLPGLAVSPARYSNIDVALVDNGAMLPVLCQSIRVKTSLALPTR